MGQRGPRPGVRRPAMTRSADRGTAIRRLIASGWSFADVAATYELGYKELVELVHPERIKARKALLIAVRAGDLARPARCGRCTKSAPTQAHHHDYSKPYDVEWLCAPCHGAEHAGDAPVMGFGHGMDAETHRAIWCVALARQIEWADLLDMTTIPEIVATYRGFGGTYANPEAHTLAAADVRRLAAQPKEAA